MPDHINEMHSFIENTVLHQSLPTELVINECLANPSKQLELIGILTGIITFFQLIDRYMHQLNIPDAEFKHRACISDAVFHNMQVENYTPSKPTAFKSLIGLGLGYLDSGALLEKAGYAFVWTDKRDLVIIFCIINNIYNAMEIDELLEAAGLPCIFNQP